MSDTNSRVKLATTKGDIILELDREKAPATVDNFLNYVQDGFYDGTVFHRVIPDFMIQGGGMKPNMFEKKTRPPIKNEADNGLKNERGTVAMARTQVVDSATSQFFINLAGNDFLNHQGKTPAAYGYAVFGRVVEGMETVDSIAKVRTGKKGMHQDVPVEPILINQASVIE